MKSVRWDHIGAKTAWWLIFAMLVVLLVGYVAGWGCSGALGDEDDASGPILLVGPLSVASALIAFRLFRTEVSAWVLAIFVIAYPFCCASIFGPASKYDLRSFWAEAIIVVSWPGWGLFGFRAIHRLPGRKRAIDH